MRTLKLIIGWLAIIALVLFIVTNTQSAQIHLPLGTSLRAPMALLVVLAAVLGALGANMFRTLYTWARGNGRSSR